MSKRPTEVEVLRRTLLEAVTNPCPQLETVEDYINAAEYLLCGERLMAEDGKEIQ